MGDLKNLSDVLINNLKTALISYYLLHAYVIVHKDVDNFEIESNTW